MQSEDQLKQVQSETYKQKEFSINYKTGKVNFNHRVQLNGQLKKVQNNLKRSSVKQPQLSFIEEETENDSPQPQNFKVPLEVIQRMVVQKKKEILS